MAAALIIIGSLLVILNIIAIKKEKKSFSSTLTAAEIDMSEFEVEIGKLRKEFAESLLELQSEIEKLKVIINEKDNKKENFHEKENSNIKNNTMTNEVADMFSQGLTIDEISKKLNVGKGEILLIKDLYLK